MAGSALEYEGLARQGQRLTGHVGPQTATHAAKGALTDTTRLWYWLTRPFAGRSFSEGVRELGHHAVVGVRRDRRPPDGGKLDGAGSRGEQVFLVGLEVPVYM